MAPSPAAPTAAELIRSMFTRSSAATLAVDGCETISTLATVLRPDGMITLVVPGQGHTGTDIPAALELADYAPLALREPLRALIWMRGTLRRPNPIEARSLAALAADINPDPALLDVGYSASLLEMTLESVVVADSHGAEPVEPHSLLQAQPDPFCVLEADWIRHLDADHSELIELLARKLPLPLRRGVVRPLGIDRYGVRLRVEAADADHDIRLPFPGPVADPAELSRALRTLVGCPFLNGLRARSA